LADDRVRFQGEPVAAIAADTPEIAAQAADLVEVEYEELPGVYAPLAALAPDAPVVHEGGNVLRRWHLRSGDVAEGFARADVVVEQTYRTPFVDHVYLETETGIGWVDAEGVLTLRVSTQVLEHFRDVAEVLQLPHPHVRVEATTVYTNNPVASAYRCFGSIQTCLAYEGQMDALAAALGIDPLALREKNFLRKGDALATGQVLETEPLLAETMRRAWA